ncbi:MAG TPA: iron ABC transporter permease [Chitinophagaceae bacterium]|jgi:iron complex transport system permease protein|nr:iron ABC transporter permease [Chitinophagaceae bacterium]
MSKLSFRFYYISLAILLFVSLIISARVGAVNISYEQIVTFFSHKLGFTHDNDPNSIQQALFFQIRLPRVILCAFVGAALSVSGALMQALFRNPIVEPGLVGTSSGAALGAAFVFVMGKTLAGSFADTIGPFMLPLFAFLGGLLATLLVYRLSSVFGKTNVNTMLLAGIAVNALATGGTGFFSYIARDPQARSITFWNLGTLSGADWHAVELVGISTTLGILICFRYSKALNALLLGETEAGYLGINTEKLKMRIILINTFIVAMATSIVGVIGFIGLVVPHLLRMMKSSDNRFLIIASALLGAILLNLADMVSRIIVAPSEFPIGIITAFVGAPVFLILLIRNSRKQQQGGFYA